MPYFTSPLNMLQQALMSLPGGPPAPAAPTYYGPTHEALTTALRNSLTQQLAAPQVIQNMRLDPGMANHMGGFSYGKFLPQVPFWRADWFPKPAEAPAADPNAAAGPNLQGLLAPQMPAPPVQMTE